VFSDRCFVASLANVNLGNHFDLDFVSVLVYLCSVFCYVLDKGLHITSYTSKVGAMLVFATAL